MTTASTDAVLRAERDASRGPLSSWKPLIWAIFAVALVAGSVGLVDRLRDGHLGAGYGSYVPWGLWVAIYFHGIGIAAGVFAATGLGYLLGWRGFHTPRSLRMGIVLAAATVVPALIAIGLEIGRIERAWRILTSPEFTSMMAFNAWTYMALLVVCAVAWVLSFREDRGWLKPVLILGVLLSLMVPSQTGAFLAVVGAKEFWNTALLPVLMLVSGLTSGAAVLLLVRGVIAGVRTPEAWRKEAEALGRLRTIVLIGIGVYFFLEFAELTVGAWSGEGDSEALGLVLTGPYWWVFWIVHVAVGGVVAAALLLRRKPEAWLVGAAVVAFAFLSTRLSLLVPGQAVEQLVGLESAYSHPRLSYMYGATLMEYLVALFVLAVGMLVLYLGLRLSAVVETRIARRGSHDE